MLCYFEFENVCHAAKTHTWTLTETRSADLQSKPRLGSVAVEETQMLPGTRIYWEKSKHAEDEK